ncbi:MAG: DHH family phosphoesterase [Nitrosopumilaceae archaeon]|nr:DHH family phosphoesterase [Nitrosopumilaceae archaeon]
MIKKLDQALSYFNDKIKDCIKTNKSIIIITHIDCDGLVSGSVIMKSLIREGAKCTVRAVNEFSNKMIEDLQKVSRDFYVITDMGSQFSKELDVSLSDKWLVLDHHRISDIELDNEKVINAWKYGIDGGKEICAGGMAYLASCRMDEKNHDLAWLPIIAALGDRQDHGNKKSFTGLNNEIVKVAADKHQIEMSLDLLLVGRETKPIHNALASTSNPFIKGLTWNNDACLSLLNSSGVQLKDGKKWRVVSELTYDEKMKIVEAITKFTISKNSTEITEELVGYVYTLPNENRRSVLHDCREFSTMLNSCGRINKSGVGIALCIGNRESIIEAENTLMEYRKTIRKQMNVLANERWRTNNSKNFVIVNGTDVIPETMTGTICSLIASSQKNDDKKAIIVITNGENDTVKISSRKPVNCKFDINLSDIMQKCAKKNDGVGGGHNNAAGAKISKTKIDEFLECLEYNAPVM